MNDRELISRVADGDTGSFATLYDRHSGVVLGLLTRMLGRDGSAEEVLQETFLQAWDRVEEYDPGRAAPRSWLLMIARSRAVDRIRSRGSRKDRNRKATEEGVLSETVADPVAPERLEQRNRSREIRSALEALPPEQREPIELAFFEGLTHREIAEDLGTPLGTIKSRILLGMKKLRGPLTPYRT